MDKIEIISKIFEICIFPLLAILTAFIVQFIRTKMNNIADQQDNELSKKYLLMLTDTITTCVIAVNQTYVDALKKKGEFTPEAQKHAFEMVYKKVCESLTEEAKVYLNELYADLENSIKNMIEAQVRINKVEIPATEKLVDENTQQISETTE
jgi:polyhydroxyalkanoate synthesis regulator phasin